jgi:hypothetical protein
MAKTWKGLWSVALTVAAWSAVRSPAEAQTVIRDPADPAAWRPGSRVGNAVMLGGGFGNFTGDYLMDQTSPAAAWGLRWVGGTRSVIGGEFAYLGGINSLQGTVTDDYLLSINVDGSVRVGWPMPVHSALLAPFAFGGVGWTRYGLVNQGPNRGVLTSGTDHQVTIPMGLGFGFGYHGFMAEARGTYRQAFEEELFGSRDMSTWGVSLSLGGEF